MLAVGGPVQIVAGGPLSFASRRSPSTVGTFRRSLVEPEEADNLRVKDHGKVFETCD